jgi:WD40 repeat protein
MRFTALSCLLIALTFTSALTPAQSIKNFPSADALLKDAKHKEPKSGVQIGPGNTITIKSGVGTPTTINVLSFSKNGTLLAAGKDFGRVVVWDVANRKFLCAIDTGQGIVNAVAISPDGRVLATAGQGDNFKLKLWHLPEGQLLKTYDSFRGYIHSLAFGPDGSWLVLSENFGATQVLDVTNGKRLLELKDTHSPVLSADGTVLMAVDKTEFTFWNTSDWTKQRALPRTPIYAIPLALNPQMNTFVISSSGGFQLVQASTGESLPNVPSQSLPKFNISAGGFAAFDASVPYVMFGHSDGRLWAWNSRSGQICVSELMYSESGALSPDGNILAGAKDNSILAQGQNPNGMLIWDTKRVALQCGFGSSVTQ